MVYHHISLHIVPFIGYLLPPAFVNKVGGLPKSSQVRCINPYPPVCWFQKNRNPILGHWAGRKFICISIHLYIYIYMCVRMCININMNMNININININISTYVPGSQPPPTPHPMVMQIHVYINIKKQILFFFIHLYQQPQLLAVKKKLEPTWNRFPSQVPCQAIG